MTTSRRSRAVWTAVDQALSSLSNFGVVLKEVRHTLSGRTLYRQTALEEVSRSPVAGLGLTSGTRLDVLGRKLGSGQTSTIHSTWVEAYVGTGIIGVSLLIGAFLYGWRVAHRRAREGDLLGVLLLVGLTVRSVTGSTFELPGMLFVLFVLVSMGRPAGRVSARTHQAYAVSRS